MNIDDNTIRGRIKSKSPRWSEYRYATVDEKKDWLQNMDAESDYKHTKKYQSLIDNIGKRKFETIEEQQKLSEIQKLRWFVPGAKERLGDTIREKWKDPIYRQKLSGINGASSKSVYILNDFFPTLKEASKFINVSPSTIAYRVKSTKLKWVDYRFAIESEIREWRENNIENKEVRRTT